MDYGSYRFNDVGYSGIINSKLSLVWSDNTKLFRRLLKNSDKLSAMISDSRPTDTLYHIFKYETLRYCAVFNKMAGEMYICRIYREENGFNESTSELLEEIDFISHSALNILALTKSISKASGANEKIPLLLSTQSQEAEAIYNYCLNIKRRFEKSDKSEYVQFRKRIFNTFGRISFLGRKMNKELSLSLDVKYECIKIDYESVEMAIVNLAKIFYLGSVADECGDFWITAEGSCIRFSLKFKVSDDYDDADYDSEIRTVKSIFSSLSGQAVFEGDDNSFIFGGSVPCECFYDLDNIKEEDILYPDNILNSKNSEANPDKYRSYFTKLEKGFLGSAEPVFENVDVADYASIVLQCLNFAE